MVTWGVHVWLCQWQPPWACAGGSSAGGEGGSSAGVGVLNLSVPKRLWHESVAPGHYSTTEYVARGAKKC